MCRPERRTDRRGLLEPRERTAVRTRRRRRSKRESFAMLLLLAFFAEDILAAILDALALVRLRLAPAADLGRDLANLLLVDSADLDRVLVGSLHIDAFGQLVVHVVAVTELEAKVLALRLGAVADAGDLEHLGEALGHPGDEVLHVGAGHAPRRAVALRVGQRSHFDLALADLIFHEIVEQLHRERALGALHGQDAAFNRSRDSGRKSDWPLADTGHQNTSARTSPPTFWSRASASDNTPRGVDTITVPRPLRMRGSSRAAE